MRPADQAPTGPVLNRIGAGKDGSTLSAVMQGLRSENRDSGTSSQKPPSASDAPRRTSHDPPVIRQLNSDMQKLNFPRVD